MVTLKKNIESKQDLIINSSSMIVDYCQQFEIPYYKVGQLDLDGMKEMFEIIMDGFPTYEKTTKDAIKKYYHSSSFFGISSSAMNRYLCDVREYFRDNL